MSVDASNRVFHWYDSHRRSLPWRFEPGETPDAYRVWLSEIMLQQTTVAAVRPYFETFLTRWPSIDALAAADEADVMSAWAGLGYYARARNLIACAREVARREGFPETEAGLRELPGVGRYTAAAVAAIAFGERAVVVDANVERVVSRLFAVEETLPAARERLYELTDRITPSSRAGDFAQAMMDIGATICTPRDPACMVCPLAADCRARAEGRPTDFPRKLPKRAKPHRHAFAYWLEHDGDVMLVRRPKRGMLGGMLALPTGSWGDQPTAGEGAPADVSWEDAGAVEHVFTHFSLTMRLLCGDAVARRDGEIWWPAKRLDEAGLPTLFAKLARRGAEWRDTA